MKITRTLNRWLRTIGQSLQVRAGCSLTGVEPEWLARCAQQPPARAGREDDAAALRYARSL